MGLEANLGQVSAERLNPYVEPLGVVARGIERCVSERATVTVGATMGSIQMALHDLMHNATDDEPAHPGRPDTCELLGQIAAEAILALQQINDGKIAQAMDQLGRKVWPASKQ